MLEQYKTLKELEEAVREELKRSGLSEEEATAEIFRACARARTTQDKMACLVKLLREAQKGRV